MKCNLYNGSDDGVSEIGSSKDAGRWINRDKGGRGNNRGDGKNWNEGRGNNRGDKKNKNAERGGNQWNGGGAGRGNDGHGGKNWNVGGGKQSNGGNQWNTGGGGHGKGHGKGHWRHNGGESSSEEDDIQNKIWIVGSKSERGLADKRRILGSAWDFASNEEENYSKEWMRHIFSLTRECTCKQKKKDFPMPPSMGIPEQPPGPPSKDGLDLKPKLPVTPQSGDSGPSVGLPGRLVLPPFLVKKTEQRGSLKVQSDKKDRSKPAVVASKQSSVAGKGNQHNKHKGGKANPGSKNIKVQSGGKPTSKPQKKG